MEATGFITALIIGIMEEGPTEYLYSQPLAAAVLLLLLAGIASLICRMRRTEAGRRNLPILLLVVGFSLTITQNVLFWTGWNRMYPFLHFYDGVWYLAFGPLLYIYLVRIYRRTYRSGWWHLLPAFTIFLLTVFFRFRTQGLMEIEDVRSEPLFRLFWQMRNPWVAGLSLLVYAWMMRDMVELQVQDPERPETEAIRLRWVGYLQRLFQLFIFAYFSYYLLVPFPFFNLNWDYAISLVMAVSIYGLATIAWREPAIFNGEWFRDLFRDRKATETDWPPQYLGSVFERLNQFLVEERPFLDGELRLAQLADRMEVSLHLLSEAINRYGGKNFNQYINAFRLREAERLLLLDERFSVKDVCFRAGFNNKVTFYDAFRRKHGLTPSQWRAERKKEGVLTG